MLCLEAGNNQYCSGIATGGFHVGSIAHLRPTLHVSLHCLLFFALALELPMLLLLLCRHRLFTFFNLSLPIALRKAWYQTDLPSLPLPPGKTSHRQLRCGRPSPWQ